MGVGGYAEYEPGAGRGRAAVRVRAAARSDLEAIVAIQEQAGRDAHPESYATAIADDARCVVVAELDDPGPEPEVVAGWAQTYHHTDRRDRAPSGHYLGGVTVDPAWRRQGVAVALTEARMRWIEERADEAFYVVNPANQASIDLHRRWGFVEIARAGRLTGVEFAGGVGILMRAGLRAAGQRAASR
jgi:aminoglycoside 6'-N-acetyltransferase I